MANTIDFRGSFKTPYDGHPIEELQRDPTTPRYPREEQPTVAPAGGNIVRPLLETPRQSLATFLAFVAFVGVGLESQPIARGTVTTAHAIESSFKDFRALLKGIDPNKPSYPKGARASVRNPDDSRYYPPSAEAP